MWIWGALIHDYFTETSHTALLQLAISFFIYPYLYYENMLIKSKKKVSKYEGIKKKKKIMETHRALVRSVRSLSESSKKRDTTSTTNSGLVSSCSCLSCKNWASRKPFYLPPEYQKRKQNKRKCTHVSKKPVAQSSPSKRAMSSNDKNGV